MARNIVTGPSLKAVGAAGLGNGGVAADCERRAADREEQGEGTEDERRRRAAHAKGCVHIDLRFGLWVHAV